MPRYYFHISTREPDRDGVELPDLAAARSEAIRTLGELMHDYGPAHEHLTALPRHFRLAAPEGAQLIPG